MIALAEATELKNNYDGVERNTIGDM